MTIRSSQEIAKLAERFPAHHDQIQLIKAVRECQEAIAPLTEAVKPHLSQAEMTEALQSGDPVLLCDKPAHSYPRQSRQSALS